jgi:hypothetical protein
VPRPERRLAALAQDGQARVDVACTAVQRVVRATVEELAQFGALVAHALLGDQRATAVVLVVQVFACGLDPVLHLAETRLQDLRGLLDREAVDLGQQQRRGLLRRQVAQRARAAHGQMFAGDGARLGRTAQQAGLGEEGLAALGHVTRLQHDVLAPGAVAAQVVDREVGRHAEQPGAHAVGVLRRRLIAAFGFDQLRA